MPRITFLPVANPKLRPSPPSGPEWLHEVKFDGFRIQPGEVAGVGTSRKSILESFGIETAADVDEARLYRVPGVGAKLRSGLIAWRHSIEGRFRS